MKFLPVVNMSWVQDS